jgi:hypothetical protein
MIDLLIYTQHPDIVSSLIISLNNTRPPLCVPHLLWWQQFLPFFDFSSKQQQRRRSIMMMMCLPSRPGTYESVTSFVALFFFFLFATLTITSH